MGGPEPGGSAPPRDSRRFSRPAARPRPAVLPRPPRPLRRLLRGGLGRTPAHPADARLRRRHAVVAACDVRAATGSARRGRGGRVRRRGVARTRGRARRLLRRPRTRVARGGRRPERSVVELHGDLAGGLRVPAARSLRHRGGGGRAVRQLRRSLSRVRPPARPAGAVCARRSAAGGHWRLGSHGAGHVAPTR